MYLDVHQAKCMANEYPSSDIIGQAAPSDLNPAMFLKQLGVPVGSTRGLYAAIETVI